MSWLPYASGRSQKPQRSSCSEAFPTPSRGVVAPLLVSLIFCMNTGSRIKQATSTDDGGLSRAMIEIMRTFLGDHVLSAQTAVQLENTTLRHSSR